MTTTLSNAKYSLRMRVGEFKIPPIREGLVLGRQAPIGCMATRRALELLMPCPFAHIELDDEIISDILVREAVLRRIPKDQLIGFILEKIKPLMGDDEILHLDMEIEVYLEGGLE